MSCPFNLHTSFGAEKKNSLNYVRTWKQRYIAYIIQTWTMYVRLYACKDNKTELNNAINDSISIILNIWTTSKKLFFLFLVLFHALHSLTHSLTHSIHFIVILLENHLNLANYNFVVFNVHLILYTRRTLPCCVVSRWRTVIFRQCELWSLNNFGVLLLHIL